MADNTTTQSATPATIPAGKILGAYEGTFSGDTALVAPVVLNTVSGAEGARTFAEISAANPLPVSDAGGSLTVDGTVAVSGTVTVGSHAVTNAGTFAVQESGAALTALQLIDNLVLAEDAAHVTADPGVQMLAVRQTSPANLSGAAGDYEPLQVNAGRLWASATIDAALPAGTNNIGDVDVLTVPAPLSTTGNGTAATALRVTVASDSTGTVATTNAGTFAVQESGAALTALQVIDNPVVVDDAAFTPATTSVMVAGFTFDDVAPDSVNEGDAGAARMSANRNIYTTLRDAAGNERGANINASNQLTVSVDNTVTVASHAVTNAGTFAVQESGAALTALQLLGNLVLAEDAAHVSADPGVQMLAVRQTSPANLSGAAGDYEPLQVNAGRLWASATIDAALPAGTNNIGDVDVLTVPAPLSTTGNGTAATALRVTVASDSTGTITANAGTGTFGVAEVRPASAALSNVAASATSVTLLASNASRKQATIYNDSTVALYAKFGATASTTSFTVKIFGNGYYELPFPVYSGVIDGIWDSASGTARVTELS